MLISSSSRPIFLFFIFFEGCMECCEARSSRPRLVFFIFYFFFLCTEAQGCVGCWEAGVWGHCDASPRCAWVSACGGVGGRVLERERERVCVFLWFMCICLCVCLFLRLSLCLLSRLSRLSFLSLSTTLCYCGICSSWCALNNKKRSFSFISLQHPQRFEFVVTEV